MNTSWPAKPHDAQTAARIIFADHSRSICLSLARSTPEPGLMRFVSMTGSRRSRSKGAPRCRFRTRPLATEWRRLWTYQRPADTRSRPQLSIALSRSAYKRLRRARARSDATPYPSLRVRRRSGFGSRSASVIYEERSRSSSSITIASGTIRASRTN
jgi:hypothetical protein